MLKAVDQQFAAHLDIRTLVQQSLPPRAAAALSAPLAGAADSLVSSVATQFVHSDSFVALWVGMNRAAHTALADILTGKHSNGTDVLSVRDGILMLDLAPVVSAIKTRSTTAGLTIAEKVATVGVTIKIAEVKGLLKAQAMVRLLNRVARWPPLLALICFAGAVLAAHRRRRVLVSLALLVWAIAWSTGPSRQAHAVRRSVGAAARAATARWSDSRLAAVTVSMGIVALAALILVLWTDPGLLTVIVVGLVAAALVVLVYSLRPPPTTTLQP